MHHVDFGFGFFVYLIDWLMVSGDPKGSNIGSGPIIA